MTMANQVQDFKEFDKKMLALIEAEPKTAAALTAALHAEAKLLMSAPRTEFRVIDRRLQALRKKNKIFWERRGSFVVWMPSKC